MAREIFLKMGTLLTTTSRGGDDTEVIIDQGDEMTHEFEAAVYKPQQPLRIWAPGSRKDSSIIKVLGEISPDLVVQGITDGLYQGNLTEDAAARLKELTQKPPRRVILP